MAKKIGATREIARFARETKFDRLPREVVDKVKELVLDQIGVELACSTLPWNQLIYQYVQDADAAGPSSITGFKFKTNPEYAALANATFGHGFEIDDYHLEALSHPGCVTVPTALAIGEKFHSNGRQMITAIAIGAETIIRIGLAIGSSMVIERGFHETCIEGTFGAAAATGNMLGFNEETMINALSIAGSHSSGTTEYARTGGDVKRLHAGLGAVGGIRSALLARLGFTGPSTIIEGKRGIFQAFANTYDMGKLLNGLGEKYHLLETCLKPYCCCALIHAHIEAVARVMKENKIKPGDIAEITMGVDRLSTSHVGSIGPVVRDITGAQFSTHYSLGLTVVKGANDFTAYVNAMKTGFKDPEVLDISRRVKMVLDADCDRLFPKQMAGKATIKTRDRRTASAMVIDPLGSMGHPMTRPEMEKKFIGLATVVVSEARARQIIKAVDHLEDLKDINELTKLLGPGRSRKN